MTIKSSRRVPTGSLHLMKQNAVQQTVSHDKVPWTCRRMVRMPKQERFPGCAVGIRPFSHWAILLVLAAEGLFCGSRVGLWRADQERNSRMIRGIIVSRGPLALFSCERKGVCVAGLLLCGFENISERAATFWSARKGRASPSYPPYKDNKRDKHYIQRAL